MSFVRILVHTVWATKNRFPYLNDTIREEVIQLSGIRSVITGRLLLKKKLI